MQGRFADTGGFCTPGDTSGRGRPKGVVPRTQASTALVLHGVRLLARQHQALPLAQARSLLTPVTLLTEHPCRAWPLLPAGRKIMTTSQDNRIRVWDYLYSTEQVGSS